MKRTTLYIALALTTLLMAGQTAAAQTSARGDGAGPGCKSPTDLMVQNVTETSATLFWNLSPEGAVPGAYILSLVDGSGNAVIAGDTIAATGSSHTLTGLTANSVYTVTLRGDCSAAMQGESETGSLTFVTLCAPRAAPYVANFDSLSAGLPPCCYGHNASASSAYCYGSSGRSIALSTTSADAAYIIFPEVSLAAGQVEITFFIRQEAVSPAGPQNFMVALSGNPYDISEADIVYQDTLRTTQWREVRVNTALCSAPTAPTARLMIVANAGFAQRSYIDNVSIHATPTCLRPEDFRVIRTGPTWAELGWTTTNAAEARIAVMPASGGTVYRTATANPYTVTGLTPNLDYQFAIRGICSITDSSELNPYPVETHTLCLPAETAAMQEGFEQTIQPYTAPECWQMGFYTDTAARAPFTTTNAQSHTGARSMQITALPAGSRAYLATQALPIDSANRHIARLWMKRDLVEMPAADEGLKVWALADVRDTLSGICLGYIHRHIGHQPVEQEPGWYEYEYLISTAGNLHIVLEGITVGNAMYIDDISVSPAPACMRPHSAAVTANSDTSAAITWQAGDSETEWQLEYQVMNTAGDTLMADTVTTTTPSMVIAGLSPSVTHLVRGTIRAVCSATAVSEPRVFAYAVDMPCAPITALPYSESFEGARFPPLCWQSLSLGTVTAANLWTRTTTAARVARGRAAAAISTTPAGSATALVSPEIALPAASATEVRFAMYRGAGGQDKQESLDVYTSTAADDTTAATRIGSIPLCIRRPPVEDSDGMHYYCLPIPAGIVGTRHILFVLRGDGSAGTAIDDISVRAVPSCPDIRFNTVDVTSHSAGIVIAGESCDWQISYGTEGTAAGLGTTVACTATDHHTLAGLMPETTYDIYVRRVCGAEQGEWSQRHRITTLCAPATLPIAETFEAVSTDGSLAANSCYTVSDSGATSTPVVKVLSGSLYNRTPGGSQGLVFASANYNSAVSADGTYTISRRVRLTAGQVCAISVYAKAHSYAANPGLYDYDLAFVAGTSPDSLTPMAVHRVSRTAFEQYTCYFTAPADGECIIGIRTRPVNSRYYLYLDDYSIEPVGCTPPEQAHVQALTATSAVLRVAPAPEQWQVAVSTSEIDIHGIVAGEAFRCDSITADSIVVAGLAPNTEYHYTCRSICNGVASPWMPAGAFRTRCTTIEPPYHTGFATADSTTCWTPISAGTVSYSAAEGNDAPGSMVLNSVTAISPEVAAVSLTGYTLSGFIRSATDSATMDYGVMTDPDDPATYVALGSVLITPANTWVEFTAGFDSLAVADYAEFATARYIGLTAGPSAIYVDDLTIESTPTCAKPTAGRITATAARQVTVDWTDRTQAAQWVIRAVDDNGRQTTAVVAQHPATITGLAPATHYNIYVAAICSSADTSAWTGSGQITTDCDIVTEDYYENFNHMEANHTPDCWDIASSTHPAKATNPEYIFGVFDLTGNKCLRLFNNSLANNYVAEIRTPEFVLDSGRGYTLEFDLAHQASCGSLTLNVERRGTAGRTEIGTYQKRGSSTSYKAVTTWYHYTVDLTPYAGDTLTFYFTARPNKGTGAIFIDNFAVMENLACSDVSNIRIIGIAEHSATAAFADTCGAHSRWQYTVVARGEGVASGTADTTSADAIRITGLAGATRYDLYVRSVCSAGNYGHWLRLPFATTGAPATVPYVTDFSDPAEGAAWLTTQQFGQNRFVVGTDPAAVLSGGKALYVTDNNARYAYDMTEPSLCYATRLVELGEGEYNVELDWQCSGGYSTYHFARMYLLPAYADYRPGCKATIETTFYNNFVWPEGNIAIDGGAKINLIEGIRHTRTVVNTTGRPGVYNIVLVWKNHRSTSGRQAPLAVDNIAIRPATCADVNADSITTVTATSATVWLDSRPGEAVHYVVSRSVVAADSVAAGTTTDTAVVITGLEPGTAYQLLLRRECSPGDVSAWTLFDFQTECAARPLPITESFEGSVFPPVCWTEATVAPGTGSPSGDRPGHWAQTSGNTTIAVQGDKALLLNQGKGASAMLVSPEFVLSADAEYHYSFYRSINGADDYTADHYDLYLSRTPALAEAELIASFTAYNPEGGGTVLRRTNADLPPGLAGSYYAILVGRAGTEAFHTLYVDDITIDRYPLCREPDEPAVTASTATTADVAATMHGQTAVEFGIAPYSAAANPADITATVSSATGRAVISGLAAGTSYALFARAICASSGDTTAWSAATRLVTKATDCFAPENIRVIRVVDTAATICWNHIPNAGQCEYRIADSPIAGTTANDTATLTGLAANTAYRLNVRGLCSADTTEWSTFLFHTIGTPAELPYATGFDNDSDNALWQTVSAADGNRFVVGGTDTAGVLLGRSGLYISADDRNYGQSIPGLGQSYPAGGHILSVVYALRTLHFDHAGLYEVSFDWQCRGSAVNSPYLDAYGRVFIAPAQMSFVADVLASATAAPAGTIPLILRMDGRAGSTTFSTVISIDRPGYHNLVFQYTVDNIDGLAEAGDITDTPLAVDNVAVREVTCLPMQSPEIISIRDTAATIAVTRDSTSAIEYSLTTADTIASWQRLDNASSVDTLVFTGLTPGTTYNLFIRQVCSETDRSSWTRATVTTTTEPAALPYLCDFETVTEANRWLFAQTDQANYFVIGTAAGNGGQKGLYITNDGSSFAYTTNAAGTSYAYRTVYLEAGIYSYGFDWTAQGDQYGNDFGRAFLLPATEPLTAGTEAARMVPARAIELDGGTPLEGNAVWSHRSGTVAVSQNNSYNIVFAWHSDGLYGTTPIAIDNVELAHMACRMPDIRVSSTTGRSAELLLGDIPYGASVEYSISGSNSADDILERDTIAYVASSANATITGLSPARIYAVTARSLCADGDESGVATTTFSTACSTVTDYPYTEGFELLEAEPYSVSSVPANRNDIANHCWLVGSTSEQCGTAVSNASAHRINGLNSLVIYNATSTDRTVVALPEMDSIARLRLSFRYSGTQGAAPEIGYLTNASLTNTFVTIATAPAATGTAEYSIVLSAAPASAKRIALRHSSYYNIVLDDIRVTRYTAVPAYSDTICYESDYNEHGFHVANADIAVGTNRFTRLDEAAAPGQSDTLFTANVYRRARAECITYDTICEGEAYERGLWSIPADMVATQSYVRRFAGASVTGCDSTVTLHLTVLPSQATITDTICAGTSRQFGDTVLLTSGQYSRSYLSALGCSVTETLSLVVLPDTIMSTATLCQAETPYLWNGRALTSSGIYHATVAGPRGCSQTEELRLTVVPADSTVSLVICSGGQAQVADTFLTSAGNYTLARVNDRGCDITYHISVTVNAPVRDTVADYACEGRPYYGYGMKGAILVADTTLELWSRTADMCDSVTVVSIAFLPTQHTDVYDTITAGDAYEWNDNTYTQPGDYTVALQDNRGCDSVVTLHLEVKDDVDNVYHAGSIRLVPNPARRGQAALLVTAGVAEIVRVEIINSFGAVVSSTEPHSTPIHITAPAVAGVYHVRVVTRSGEIYVEKLIVE